MKKILLFVLFLIVSYNGFAATYYFKPAQADLTVLANWGQNTDGTGTAPGNFTSAGDIFIIASSEILSTNWVMNQTLQIGVTTVSGITLQITTSGYTNAATIDITQALSGTNTLLMEENTYPNIGTLHPTSTVNYNKSGGIHYVKNGVYGNLIIGNGGVKEIFTTTSTLVINSNLAINSSTLELPFGGAVPIITGNFTTTSSNASNSILLIKSTSTTPITSGITYNFKVEYSGAGNKTAIPGIFMDRLKFTGSGAINCIAAGIYELRFLVNNCCGFTPVIDFTGFSGIFNASTSTFWYNGAGFQKIQESITYYNLTYGNSGIKGAGGNIFVTNLLSIEEAAFGNSTIIYNSTGKLQYRNATTRTRFGGCGAEWNRDVQSVPNSPIRIIVDNTAINIDDPSDDNGGTALNQARLSCPLEIKNNGSVNLIFPRFIPTPPDLPASRIDLFGDLITSTGGVLNGISKSIIHISGSINQSIGLINSAGTIKLDHQAGGTATFTDNITVGNLRMFVPYATDAGGTYTFNSNAVLTVNGNATLGKGVLQLNNSANAAGVYHTHNIFGNLFMDKDSVSTAAADFSTIDFSSQNVGTPESVILNVTGDFSKLAGPILASNTSTTIAGRINFSGIAQNIFNGTAGSSTSEVNYHVMSPSVCTLINNSAFTTTTVPTPGPNSHTVIRNTPVVNDFDVKTFTGETFEVETGGTLVFDATKLVTGGIFNLNSGGTVRTANLGGITSPPTATGSVRTATRNYNSGGSLHYNGAALQNSGVFTTTPALLTINNLTVQNSSNVTAQQDFTVVGTYSQTLGAFDITGRNMNVAGNIVGVGSGTLRGGVTGNLTVSGAGTPTNPIYFDQSSPGVSQGTGAADDLTALVLGSSNRFNNFTLNRTGVGATLTLGNKMQITNVFTPTTGTLASGGNLVMLSTQTIASSILTLGAGAAITGDVIVQSFFKGGTDLVDRGMRMIAFPIQEPGGANSIYKQMKFRFIMTGGPTAGVGMDLGGVKVPYATTIMTYNEPVAFGSASTYPVLNNINDLSVAGKGYFFFFRGNRLNATTTKVNDGTGGNAVNRFANPEDWTGTYIGTVNQGDVTISGTRTVDGTNTSFDGYNLIGNPYPGTLDFSLFKADNTFLADQITITKPNRTGFASTSNGVTNNYFTKVEGTPTASSEDMRLVQTGQGFLVKKTGAGTSVITFKESHKASAANAPTAKRYLNVKDKGIVDINGIIPTATANTSASAQRKLLRINLEDEETIDQATIVLESGNDKNYDEKDVKYFGGSSVSCNTLTAADTVATAINFMPDVSQVDTVRIIVNSTLSNPNLKLSFPDITGAGDRDVVLKDALTNKIININASHNEYKFGIDKANKTTFARNRFSLIFFNKDVLPVRVADFKAEVRNNGILLIWKTLSELNAQEIVIERSADGVTFEAIKIQPVTGDSKITLGYSYMDTNPFNGTIYYRLKKVDIDGSFKYSDVISVNFGLSNENEVAVYPNPVKNVMNVNWKTNRSVDIKLYGTNGRLVKSFLNVKTSLKSDVSNLPSGIYIIKVIDHLDASSIAVSKFIKE